MEVAGGGGSDAKAIEAMFDGIAPRYDALNHLLSAGLDRRWRRRAVRALALTGRERLLDVCTGTADLAIEATSRARPAAAEVVGVDFSAEMLRVARAKLRRAAAGARVVLVRGDATRLPLATGSVDAAMIGFGIRNVADPPAACVELVRVLRPGGRLAILEFGMPRLPFIATFYRWYFTKILPRVGRSVSRHQHAYHYLPASVARFPAGEAFADVLIAAGFRDVRADSLSAGIVYLYTARTAGAAGQI